MKNIFVTLHNTQEVTLSLRCMNPFKETCKYVQEYRYFSTTGYCAPLGCQTSKNCFTASYQAEVLEGHLYIHGRVAAISKIYLNV